MQAISNGSGRIRSVDILRGVVMILMAIDHVRVYSGVPAGGPTAGVFLTRWVTHFCAPVFVFLAGTGAFLHGRRLDDLRALRSFLLSRGLMLVVLELTLIRFSWTFNLNYGAFVLAGVIWMLGWCMVLLALLVSLSPRAIGWTGLVIVLFQQIFGLVPRLFPANIRESVAIVWNFFYPAGAEGWERISILYTIVPWIGVMALGYAFGLILLRDDDARRRWCRRVGLTATALFLVLGSLAAFVQGGEGSPPPFWMRLLNQQKYPASQLFLLMTLGPAIALVPLAERARGWIADACATFGRVPMFYYVLHIPLIHVTSLLVWWLRTGQLNSAWFATAPYTQVPFEARWSLPILYAVFALDVLLLYWPCRAFAAVKRRGGKGWLSWV